MRNAVLTVYNVYEVQINQSNVSCFDQICIQACAKSQKTIMQVTHTIVK